MFPDKFTPCSPPGTESPGSLDGTLVVMNDTENYRVYARLADELVEKATKDQLAEVAQLLALNIHRVGVGYAYAILCWP